MLRQLLLDKSTCVAFSPPDISQCGVAASPVIKSLFDKNCQKQIVILATDPSGRGMETVCFRAPVIRPIDSARAGALVLGKCLFVAACSAGVLKRYVEAFYNYNKKAFFEPRLELQWVPTNIRS